MKTATVCGAGLVGSLWSIYLKKLGYDVEVFEKRPDMRLDTSGGGRSINLVVTSRGIHALQKIGLWGEVSKITVPVHGRMMHDREGKLTYQPYGRDESECNYSVSRGDLNKLLMTEAEKIGVKFYFSKDLSSVDFDTKTINFEDNSKQGYEILFGTDGGGSQVRKSLMDFVPGAQAETTPMEIGYKELLMPAADSGAYKIEKNALHIWPRGKDMFMALPNLDGSFTMTLYLPKDKFALIKSEEDLEVCFKKDYSDTIKLMPGYKEEYFENPEGFLGTLRCSPWVYEDSVCLLGDAAHAIVPFFGQGMNAGFEDCSYLMDFYNETKNWQQTLIKYNDFQKPNGDAIADMALENAVEMSEKVGQVSFLLKKKVEQKIEKIFPEKYRSRYGMVTYTLAPYDVIKKLGRIQAEVIEELCQGITVVEDVNFELAEHLIDSKVLPFLETHAIDISRFKH